MAETPEMTLIVLTEDSEAEVDGDMDVRNAARETVIASAGNARLETPVREPLQTKNHAVAHNFPTGLNLQNQEELGSCSALAMEGSLLLCGSISQLHIPRLHRLASANKGATLSP